MNQWEGVGLGLAVVSSLTKAMQGNFGAYNNDSGGSTFWVSFKVAPPSLSFDQSKGNEKSRLDEIRTVKKVLYIEDVMDNIELMEAMLESVKEVSFSYETTGKTGLKASYDEKPDLILLDLGLPDMDGRDVLEQLKANEQTKGIPVIVVSADAYDKTIKELSTSGCEGYITKPINLDNLKQTVLKAFEQSNS